MKNSKKGFTLTEVLIVTAIIVILGGAAIAGIAVSIKNAQDSSNDLKSKQGENWESEAVLEVKKTKVELGNEQIYEESADTPAPTGSATNNEELDQGTTDAPTTTPDGGNTNTNTNTNGNTNGNTNTNTNGNTNGNTNTNTNGNTNTNTNTNTGSNVVTATNTSTNAEGSSVSAYNDWGSCGQSKISLPDKCTEVTLYVPDGVSLTNCWENGLEQPQYTQNGNYVTITCKPTSSLQFQANWSSSTKDGIKVYSYKTS